MVAYDPRRPVDPAPSLTPATRAALHDALIAQWREPEELIPALRDVLHVVAQEARTRGVRPEELIIDLKTLEESVAMQSKIAARTRHRVREWIVATCVKSYFGAE